MSLQITARKSLNKAYLKVKHTRAEVELFKANLLILLEQINHAETEEFNKNVLADFLKNTFYSPNYFINTKGRNDLVIHNGKTASESVGVIIEAKRANNISEMLKKDNVNAKALQELVLYYLRERITNKNLEVRNLIVTNINEWYLFDSNVFEKHFAKNKKLVQQFIDFENGKLSGITTDFFYKEIAQPAISQVLDDIEFTYFDISEINTALRNSDKGDDTKLIPFLKLLSPQHLLKINFANDSNSLNKSFYSELLHIIGLEEIKDGSKKIISRRSVDNRDSGSLLENSILQVQSLFRLNNLRNKRSYGDNEEEQLFNVAIELVITWINRILFLKLLEAQLISYNKGDNQYEFLNVDKVKDFDELNTLFFQVLAVEPSKRNSDVNVKYAKVPYLNSSLFEPALIEQDVLFISNLNDDRKIPVISSTVLKDAKGNKLKGELNTLEYLFRFLSSYDFGADTTDEIIETNKTLISASVLGLIFEKINGYKDGSFFTPSFVTMYMCRESLRKTVVDKVNKINNLNCKNILDIYNSDLNDYDLINIVDSIKVCDPAVGSGHFLVSALNEFISIKAELGLLKDKTGKRLKGYVFELLNDELIVTDEDGDIFDYKKNNVESQRIQETLFNEKKRIIENSLFGVDINPNSVKICRLRLWIELLKNAYYKDNGELETLPNIDINIKCGNSLISRFDLDINLEEAIKKSKLKIPEYKSAVSAYRNAKSKEEKWAMDSLITEVKTGFQTEIVSNDKRVLDLYRYKNELNAITTQQSLFELDKVKKKHDEARVAKLEKDITTLENEIAEIKGNKIFEDAFEWRFEFPEVLNDNGEYVGFDLVIANPPYVFARDNFTHSQKSYFYNHYKLSNYQLNLYVLFIERIVNILRKDAFLSVITPNNWLTVSSAKVVREYILNNTDLNIVSFDKKVFEDANVDTAILTMRVGLEGDDNINLYQSTSNNIAYSHTINKTTIANTKDFIINSVSSVNNEYKQLTDKIELNAKLLSEVANVKVGLKSYQTGKGKPQQTDEIKKSRAFHSTQKLDDTYIKYLEGRDVCRYNLGWSGEYLSYGLHLAEPRQINLFVGERILVRQIPNKPPYCIHACYTNETLLNDINSMSVVNISINPKYLLAVLNSKLISFWFVHKFGKLQRGIFPQFKVNELATFPISVASIAEQDEIALIVDGITEENKAELSKNLDQLIYKIYNLNEDDVAIVEALA